MLNFYSIFFAFLYLSFINATPCILGMMAIGSFRGSYLDCPIGSYQPYGEEQNCGCLPCEVGYTTKTQKTIKKEDCFPINSETSPVPLEFSTLLSLFERKEYSIETAEYSAHLSLTPVSSSIQTGIGSATETAEIGRSITTTESTEYYPGTTEYSPVTPEYSTVTTEFSALVSITPVSRTRNTERGPTTITEIIEYSPVTTEYTAHLSLIPVSSSIQTGIESATETPFLFTDSTPPFLTPDLSSRPNAAPTRGSEEKTYSTFTPCVPGMTAVEYVRGPYYVDCPIGTYQPYGFKGEIPKRNCNCLPCDKGYTTESPRKTKKGDCIPEKISGPQKNSSLVFIFPLLISFFLSLQVFVALYIKLPSFTSFTDYFHLRRIFGRRNDAETEYSSTHGQHNI